jgi:hypothetical protein
MGATHRVVDLRVWRPASVSVRWCVRQYAFPERNRSDVINPEPPGRYSSASSHLANDSTVGSPEYTEEEQEGSWHLGIALERTCHDGLRERRFVPRFKAREEAMASRSC